MSHDTLRTLLVLASLLMCWMVGFTRAQADVLGCGGFIQVASDLAKPAKLDLSVVSVQIVTEAGTIKETMECAPNGYYFLPVYEGGSFYLRVQGPTGWSIEPQSVKIDTLKQCNDDINFIINGFSVSGGISTPEGCDESPEGVLVSLLSGEKMISKTSTDSHGRYHFNAIQPGNLRVKAERAGVNFLTNDVEFSFSWDNVELTENLQITGYLISGMIEAEDSDKRSNVFVELQKKSTRESIGTIQCDASGRYQFDNVPCGTYVVIPSYVEESGAKYDIHPQMQEVHVRSTPAQLSPFSITGFSVSGRVLDHTGAGIEDCVLFANGKRVASTNSKGEFRWERVSRGSYQLEVKKQHYNFDILSLDITPQNSQLGDIRPTGYDVCGSFSMDSKTLSAESLPRLITISSSSDSSFTPLSITSHLGNEDAEFCVNLQPGVYLFEPSLEAVNGRNVLFSPHSKTVQLEGSPVFDVNFVQVRVTVSGSVSCLTSPCDLSTTVILESLDTSSSSSPRVTTGLEVNMYGNSRNEDQDRFIFRDVLPGEYAVYVEKGDWCWNKQRMNIKIEANDVSDIEFVQSGYKLPVQISESGVELHWKHSGSGRTGSVDCDKGNNDICLPLSGSYQVHTESCYFFGKEPLEVSTSQLTPLSLTTQSYRFHGTVTNVPANTTSLKVEIVAHEAENQKELERNFVLAEISSTNDKTRTNVLTFSGIAPKHSIVSISPVSDDLLFNPAKREISLKHDRINCLDSVDPFIARVGIFLSGHVEPRMPGVSITVKATSREIDVEDLETTVLTDENGEYSLGPFYDGSSFEEKAAKDGFYFKQTDYGFTAVQLGSASVQVIDESGAGVSGVLLSITGEEAFRSNVQTQADGTAVFAELFPGTYYLRSLLKEYNFEPSSVTLEIQEGEMTNLKISASRYAYSCYGSVHALDGYAEKQVTILAKAVEGTEKEEAQSDEKGQYRIRGLLPGKRYLLTVVAAGGSTERASPSNTLIEMGEEDLHDKNFIVFRSSSVFDIIGKVNVDKEYRESITIELHQAEGNSGKPVKVFELKPISPFFHFPEIPKGDYELVLVHKLHGKQYVISGDTAVTVQYEKDQVNNEVYKEFTLHVSMVAETAEIAQTPFFLLVLFVAGYLVFKYRSELNDIYENARSGKMQIGKKEDEVDDFIDSVINPKRKTSTKVKSNNKNKNNNNNNKKKR